MFSLNVFFKNKLRDCLHSKIASNKNLILYRKIFNSSNFEIITFTFLLNILSWKTKWKLFCLICDQYKQAAMQVNF